MIGRDEVSLKLAEVMERWPEPDPWFELREIDKEAVYELAEQMMKAIDVIRDLDPDLGLDDIFQGVMTSFFCVAYELGVDQTIHFGIGAGT